MTPPSSAAALGVLIATHNGAGTLPQSLAALERVRRPEGGWSLLIADNASTDDTPSVLAAFKERLPLTVISVPRRGKNVALNEALAALQCDLVVLTDDDTLADSNWLVELEHAARSQPTFDLFGGTIEGAWPDDRCPEWIDRLVNQGATFGITPRGLANGPIPAVQVWGGNMAVRRRVFLAGHRFGEHVGPAAGQYVMGSEVEFGARLEALGYRSWFVPAARVGHIIRPHQLEAAWIIQRAYRLGRHMIHQDRAREAPEVARFRGAPRWMWRRFLQEHLRSLLAAVRSNSDERFLAEWELSYLRGYLDEAARSREPGKS
jgi:glycosyltransferase involved in cell wall biosynthesis